MASHMKENENAQISDHVNIFLLLFFCEAYFGTWTLALYSP